MYVYLLFYLVLLNKYVTMILKISIFYSINVNFSVIFIPKNVGTFVYFLSKNAWLLKVANSYSTQL